MQIEEPKKPLRSPVPKQRDSPTTGMLDPSDIVKRQEKRRRREELMSKLKDLEDLKKRKDTAPDEFITLQIPGSTETPNKKDEPPASPLTRSKTTSNNKRKKLLLDVEEGVPQCPFKRATTKVMRSCLKKPGGDLDGNSGSGSGSSKRGLKVKFKRKAPQVFEYQYCDDDDDQYNVME